MFIRKSKYGMMILFITLIPMLLMGFPVLNILADMPPEVTINLSAVNVTPDIDIWYGDNQVFSNGTPQQWVNILGNVSDIDGDLDVVEYALNGGTSIALTVGPDGRRLSNIGDFNIELDIANLNNGANQVVITATDTASPTNETLSIVNFSYDANAIWELPDNVNWNTASDANDLSQVVDGKWSVSTAGIRTDEIGYDRIVALGDKIWTDYEVTLPITVHSVDYDAFDQNIFPYSYGVGLGLVSHWQGHTSTPSGSAIGCSAGMHCGWLPQGGNPWYAWEDDGSGAWRLDSITETDTDPLARTMTLETTYYWKFRSQTTITGTLYRLNIWENGEPEPTDWQMSIVQPPDSDHLEAGSLLLVAHHADATFGNIDIQPVYSPTLTVNKTGQGDVSLSPPGGSYTYGTQVTLTATPDINYVFNRWDGDVSGTQNPISLMMDDDKTVKATFSELISYTLSTDASLGGEVLRNPDQSEYLTGTVVSLNGVADVGWQFSHWSGDLTSDNNPDTVAMSTDKSVMGNFITLPDGIFASDDFDGCALDGVWTHIPGLPSDPAPALVGNTVVITVPSGAIHSFDGSDINVNRIMQSVADDDFELVAKFNSVVTQQYQTQGFVIEAENGDALRLEILYNDRNRFYAEKIIGGVPTLLYYSPVTPNQTPPYLKITRVGDQWTYSYAFDGLNWTSTTFNVSLNVARVGVYGGNDSDGGPAPAHTVIVDYVYNADYPGAGDIHSDRNRTLQVNTAGQGNASPTGGTYTCGTDVTLTATADPGWEFISWGGRAGGTLTETTIAMTADRVVTATFDILTFDLLTDTNGNGSVDVSETGPYAVSQSVIVTATADVGWAFDHWSGDASGPDNPLEVTMDDDKSITANFIMVDYSIHTHIVGNGDVNLSPSAPYTYGQVVSVTANPDVGWAFNQWSGDLSGSLAEETLIVQGNHVVTATFVPAEYTLSVGVTGSGSVAKNPDQLTYGYGDVVTLTATANLGYTFVRWDDDLSGTENPASVLMNANKTVQAVFSELISYTITATAGTGGAVLIDPEQPEYLTGTEISLYASPDMGWYFTDWDGDLSGTENPASVLMNANKTIQADFATLPNGAFASDDFDACTLDNVWTFYEGLSGDPTPTVSGGQVQLSVPSGNDHSIWDAGVTVPRVMQSVADDDFEIVVKFNSDVTQKYQMQGIVVEATNGDAMRLEILHDGSAVQFFATVVKDNIATPKYYLAVNGGITPDYMRLRRTGNEWAHAYSFDGETWSEQTFAETFNVARVGVYGGNESESGTDAPAHTTLIDYVYNTTYLGIGDIHPQNAYKLTLDVQGQGIISKPVDSPLYACGLEIPLTAEPEAGWEFTGWTGDLTGLDVSQNIIMTTARLVTATFAIAEYDIIAHTVGNGDVDILGTPPYHYGDVVTLTAIASAGWDFAGWQGTIIGSVPTQTLVMTQNHRLTATFSLGHGNDIFLPLIVR